MLPNQKAVFPAGNYYIVDTMTESSFCHVQVFHNPQNFRQQKVINKGATAGQPPSSYMKMESKDFYRLNRQMINDKNQNLSRLWGQ